MLRVGLNDSEGFATAALRARVNGTNCRQPRDMPRPTQTKPATHGGHLHITGVAPRLMQFDVAPASLRRGYNDIELELPKGTPQQVIWLELLIDPR